jgi:hypothetical protein
MSHNSQTCNHGREHSITIFGVKLTGRTNDDDDNNNIQLSEYQQPLPQVSTSTSIGTSYVSDNVVHAPDRSRKCKRGLNKLKVYLFCVNLLFYNCFAEKYLIQIVSLKY